MSEIIGAEPGADAADITIAVLEGGPADLPADKRRRRISTDDTKIKVQHCGGYEHFERDVSDATLDGEALIFRWTGRTRFAE